MGLFQFSFSLAEHIFSFSLFFILLQEDPYSLLHTILYQYPTSLLHTILYQDPITTYFFISSGFFDSSLSCY